MNILHLLSQTHLTGAEVYATTLIQNQFEQGHKVFQISNGFYYPSSAQQTALNVECHSKIDFFKNVLSLREFIKNNNIQVIHSHSRAAAKLAFYSTLFSRVAHVSTVHGIQHSSISKKLFNQYGQMIICVCENIKTHLITDFSYNKRRLHVVANPISGSHFSFQKKTFNFSNKIAIAIVGRTTGPKGLRTELALKSLLGPLAKNLNVSITLVGGSQEQLNLPPDLKKQIVEMSPAQLFSSDYQKFDLIIGSGRVCMEALLSGVPTIAFGEARYCGLITADNFEEFLQSNFGDIQQHSLFPTLTDQQLYNDLNNLIELVAKNKIDLFYLSELAKKQFDLNTLSQKIIRLYESAYFLKNYARWIPVLMYHKIPKTKIASQHKIYVTEADFEKHLSFFKKMGFTTLTFSELALYRKGLLSFKSFPRKPLILTFDDGYRDNLENASPLLKKYGYKAQLFLLANSQINSNNWDASSNEPTHEIIANEERQLWKNSAFEVGSHGFTHKKISTMTHEEIKSELTLSKELLQKEFSSDINTYAFTYGDTNLTAKTMTQEAGYEYAVNTDSGGLLLEEDPYAIFRVNIFPDENAWSLFKKTSKWYRYYYFLKRNK